MDKNENTTDATRGSSLRVRVETRKQELEQALAKLGPDDRARVDIEQALNETEVHEKRFRADLFYRISVVQIAVPALRNRAGDVLALAQHFIHRIAARTKKPVRGISARAARLLVDYDWPGNVRELENCMERAVALCRLDEITADDLPTKVQEHRSSRIALTADAPGGLLTIEEMDRHYIRQVLQAVAGNKTQAARVLGLHRRSLYRRLEELHALAAPAVRPDSRRAESAR